MKVVLYTHDPMLTLARSEDETVELFGQDYFDEYAVEVSDELAKELISTYEKLCALSHQVSKLRESHIEKVSKSNCWSCGNWKEDVKMVVQGSKRRKLCKECLAKLTPNPDPT